MDIKDLTRPPLLLLGLAAAAAAGFAAGLYVARHPEAGRRIGRALIGGAQRAGIALSAAGEQLGDLWAEVRDEVHAAVEAQAFAGADESATGSTGSATDPAPARGESSPARRRKTAKRTGGRRTRAG